MVWSMLWIALSGCSAPPPTTSDPPPASLAGTEEALDLQYATADWRQWPTPEHRAKVDTAVARGMAVTDPAPALDLALGDALANVLLRPNDAIVRFETHLDGLDAGAADAWLDTLLRAGDLDRLASEHQRLRGRPLHVAHPAARVVAGRAATSVDVHWTTLRDTVAAVHRVETATADTLQRAEGSTTSTGATAETAVLLLEGWEVSVVAAIADGGTDGVRSADGRWRLVDGDSPRGVGTGMDLLAAGRPTPFLLVVDAQVRGRTWHLAARGDRGTTTEFAAATHPDRLRALLAATDALLAGRSRAAADADLAPGLRQRFQADLLR